MNTYAAIEEFTAEQNEIVRLYSIIARLGRNVLTDYREAVDTEMQMGATDTEAHEYAVTTVATKYRIN